MGLRKRLWLLALAGAVLFGVSVLLTSDSDSWWYVPGYLGLTTAMCAVLAALRFPRRAATWALLAGGATGIAALFWSFVLWVAGGDAYSGAAYGLLLLVSLAAGIAGLYVVRAVMDGRPRRVVAAEAITLTLVVLAAALEAFAYEDGDANLVGLTLIPAVVLGFALWRTRAEPR